MANIGICNLPENLRYHVANNVWLRDLGDGTYKLGMTDMAQSMAGSVIHCRIKKPGKSVKNGKSLATVESGKWVGPVKAPFPCEVIAKNDAVEADATLLNRSPYREGWLIHLKPLDPAEATAALLGAAEAIEGFKTYMADHEFVDCVHCEGCDFESE